MINTVNSGKVYFIGAGCGDKELITVRGLKLLKECDAVIYDSLIDENLLCELGDNAEKIYVGKRSGKHSEKQERINEIIAEKALEGKTVARLKGGDPFVFGRGGEEILYLREKGIPYEVVPGITSAVAVPELAGIPVTHRLTSRSFHVITGHTADTVLPENLRKYSQLDGTLVFLMGLSNIDKIAHGLIAGGMDKGTPAAVISDGGTSMQKIVRDKLCNIAAAAVGLPSPAVIVVGKTAEFDLSCDEKKQLYGISVTVTGTKKFACKLAVELRKYDANVRLLPYLDVKEYEDNSAFDDAILHISDYDTVAITSVNGAEIFLKRLRKNHIDMRALSGVKIAVIGSGTAKVFEDAGMYPDILPESYTSACLGKAIAESGCRKVLILRAEKGSPELTDALQKSNIFYNEIRTYDVCAVPVKSGALTVSTDFLTFASSSGVKAFFDLGYKVSPETKIICIGEITAKALESCGIHNFISSGIHTVNGLTRTIISEANK
jgi:uroporphyrinogen III methyltransferase/synthase